MKKIFTAFIFLIFFTTGFSQKDDPGVIYWREALRLSTDDFTIIADSSTKIKGNNLALTRTGITYALTSKPKSKTFEIKMYATMIKANSFIKKRVLLAPAASINYLLNHEKKHFDISEIFAREAVKMLSQTRFSKNHVKETGALMQWIFKQSEAMQDLYDKETNNGLNTVAQKEWNEKIDARLLSLDRYKNKFLEKRFY